MRFLLIMVLAISACYAGEMTSNLLSVTSAGRTNSGKPFSITIELEHTKLMNHGKGKWIGIDSVDGRDGTAIKTLKITISGNRVEIPDKAYRDLADLHLYKTPSLMENGDRFTLLFSGSDGVGAYNGKLIMDSDRLLRRVVSEYHGQFEGKDVTIDEGY